MSILKCPHVEESFYDISLETTFYRHENPSPFGEIRRFETKIGDLRESCRFDEKSANLRTGARARREREIQ